jgi:hypothetical protein
MLSKLQLKAAQLSINVRNSVSMSAAQNWHCGKRFEQKR